MMQNAVTFSINNWLEKKQELLRLLKLLDWSTHHPVISSIIILFIITIVFTLIKVIIRMVENTILSIIHIPLRVFLGIIRAGWSSTNKFTKLILKNIEQIKKKYFPATSKYNNSIISTMEGKKMSEIYQQLTELNKQQEKLLQEIHNILEQDK